VLIPHLPANESALLAARARRLSSALSLPLLPLLLVLPLLSRSPGVAIAMSRPAAALALPCSCHAAFLAASAILHLTLAVFLKCD